MKLNNKHSRRVRSLTLDKFGQPIPTPTQLMRRFWSYFPAAQCVQFLKRNTGGETGSSLKQTGLDKCEKHSGGVTTVVKRALQIWRQLSAL